MERVVRAQHSARLGEVPVHEIGDIDIVRVLGMVSRHLPLGVSLWRLKYAGDGRSRAQVSGDLVATAARSGWGQAEAGAVVAGVVDHWLDDRCHHCQGRGYERICQTPMLGAAACAECGGLGHLSCPDQSPIAAWMLELIASLEHEAACAVIARIRPEQG